MWLRRHWQLALGCGLGLGGAGQLAVGFLGRADFDSTVAQRAAGSVYVTACLVSVAHLYALATVSLLERRRLRLALIALSAVFWSSLALVLAAGVVFRIASGSYITAGVLMFTLNGSDAIAHAAQGEYLRWAIAGVAAFLLFVTACVRVLRGAARLPASGRPRAWTLGLALLLGVSLLWAHRGDTRFSRGMFVSGPLLALASSFDADLTAEANPEGGLEPKAPPGPPRGAEVGWREAVARAASEGCGARPCARPNVVLFVLESIAPSHLGAYGAERPTPAIDRLVSEGVLMTRAWTTATHSNYAQPAILSSLFPRRGNGLDQYQDLDYPRFLFHDLFHVLGYDTATISSQDEDWQGMRRFQNTGTPTFYWYSDDYKGDALDSGVERTAPDEATTEQVLAWLARPRSGPFALYVNYQGTHFPYTLAKGNPRPYQPDEPDFSNYSYLRYLESDRDVVKNRYDNALAHVDRQIARVRKALEDAGVLDDTLVVLTADHGEMFFDREMVTHGRTLYDVESRVPVVLRWPGHLAPGRRDEPVSHLDVLPTIAELLHVPAHPSWQGRSFHTPKGADAPKEAVFLNIQGLRFADGVVCWPYKLIVDRTGKQAHLYDLAKDPGEERDLLDAEPTVAGALEDTLTKQFKAQLEYHREEALAERSERFAPRLRTCPALTPAAK